MMYDFVIEPILEELATKFWEEVGGRPSPPVDLERAVALTLPVDIVTLSQLSFRQIRRWLAERTLLHNLPNSDVLLHGLLFVHRGTGFIFVNGTDVSSERRFTLAHEIAHYLYDYRYVCERACRVLGPEATNILDGSRAATIIEQLDSLMSGIDIKPYTHLLARETDSLSTYLAYSQLENRADRLALELLAPAVEVCDALHKMSMNQSYASCFAAACKFLLEQYQLPEAISEVYAKRIAQYMTGGPSILSELGLE